MVQSVSYVEYLRDKMHFVSQQLNGRICRATVDDEGRAGAKQQQRKNAYLLHRRIEITIENSQGHTIFPCKKERFVYSAESQRRRHHAGDTCNNTYDATSE